MAASPVDFKKMKVVFVDDIGAIKEVKSSKATELNETQLGLGFTDLDSVLTFIIKLRKAERERHPKKRKRQFKNRLYGSLLKHVDQPSAVQ